MLTPALANAASKPNLAQVRAKLFEQHLSETLAAIEKNASKFGATSYQKGFNLMTISRLGSFTDTASAGTEFLKYLSATSWGLNYKILTKNDTFLVLDFFWATETLPGA